MKEKIRIRMNTPRAPMDTWFLLNLLQASLQ